MKLAYDDAWVRTADEGRAPWRSTGRAGLAAAVALALLALGARPASAKIFELTLRLHAGGMAGLYGTEEADPLSTDPDLAEVAGEDFFKARRGAAFGGNLGVEVFFVDVVYEFYQLADADGLSSTLNNFMLGFDWDFSAGPKWIFTPYLKAGFGLATQNNSWLNKKYPQISLEDLESRIVQVRLGLEIERKLGRFFRIGFEAGVGYHYMIQNASGTAANDLDGHSHGFHVMGNISLAFVWDPFGHSKKKKPGTEGSGPAFEEDNSHTPPADGRPGGSPPPNRSAPPDDGPPTDARSAPVQEPPPAAPPPATPPREVAPDGSASDSSPPDGSSSPESL